jgi:precorrin-4 methylase
MDYNTLKFITSLIENRVTELKETFNNEKDPIKRIVIKAKLEEQQSTQIALQDIQLKVMADNIQRMTKKIDEKLKNNSN